MFIKITFWSNSIKPVLKIPATLKFSCFGKFPSGVPTKDEVIKLIVSSFFKLKLNASSDPINTLLELKLFRSPCEVKFSKNSVIFFSLLSIPFKITPLTLSLLITIPSPE